jgi:Flp pilus assembly protein TadG
MKKKKGQALVEIALLVPIFLLLLGGIVDFGRILYTQSKLNSLTQESARLAGLGRSDTQVKDFAFARIDEVAKTTMKVVVSPPDTGRDSGDYVTVEISCDVKYITPFMNSILQGPFKAKTQSTIRVE